jgi:hypothetical protein
VSAAAPSGLFELDELVRRLTALLVHLVDRVGNIVGAVRGFAELLELLLRFPADPVSFDREVL